MITNLIPAAKVRLLWGGGIAVISFWDETSQVSKGTDFYEIGNRSPDVRDASADERFIRSPSVVARVVAGETLIVPIRGKVGDLASIYSFNGTGTLIWKLLASPKSVKQLAASVAQEYEVDQLQAENDVASFVNEMKAVGLLEISGTVATVGD